MARCTSFSYYYIRDFLQSVSRLSTLHSCKHHARPVIYHRRFLVQSDCVRMKAKGSKEKRKARPSTWNWEGLRCLDSEFLVSAASEQARAESCDQHGRKSTNSIRNRPSRVKLFSGKVEALVTRGPINKTSYDNLMIILRQSANLR